MNKQVESDPSMTLRVPVDLLERLKRNAQADDRTLSSYVRHVLKHAVMEGDDGSRAA